jgi:hypothetical protein
MYTTLTVNAKEFKLRVIASAVVALEKQLGGKNPLNVLMAVENGEIPSVTAVLLILHAGLQKFHHNMNWQKVLELYDEFVDSGQTYMDLIPVLIEVFKVSGFFRNPPEKDQGEQETQEDTPPELN